MKAWGACGRSGGRFLTGTPFPVLTRSPELGRPQVALGSQTGGLVAGLTLSCTPSPAWGQAPRLALNISLRGLPAPSSWARPSLALSPALCGAPCPQLVGMPYLHEVLRPVINRVFEERKYMELDPCKMDLGRTR